MVKIKLFGSLRLKTGLKELDADISKVKESFPLLAQATGLKEKDFKQCVMLINGKQVNANTMLLDGDELQLLTPAGGG
ncbi:MAG: MoaD/ThiS family protein [Firmicutes bacterium]|nr:MoaD/ThiS family protein [Bacillota bacterium]